MPEGIDTDMPFADVFMPIDARAEFLLTVVQMEGANAVEADDPKYKDAFYTPDNLRAISDR